MPIWIRHINRPPTTNNTTLAILTLLVFSCGSVSAADFDDVKPLEPTISESSDEAEQVMSGIRIPDGWKIELFAAEPDVANVVALDVDHRGRVFACETFRQDRGVTDNRAHDEDWLLADLSAETVQDRIDYHKKLLGEAAITYAQHDDRIRRLVDSNGDGKVDESTIIANGFNHLEEGTGAGILVRGKDIYYTCIPKLWKLADEDDDGVAESREVLSNGYGVRVAFRGHDLHGLIKGPDGRLYFSIGDRGFHVMTKEGSLIANPSQGAVFRCENDGSGLEVYATGLRNPQELAFNELGDLFSVDNNSDSGDQARIVHLLEGGDSGWRMYYQYLPDRGPFNQESLWKPLTDDQAAYIVPPIANFSDGPSGLAYYPGTGFGDELKNRFLLCDFRGGPSNSGIRSFRLDPQGAFYKLAEDAQPIWNCLPTDLTFGPDGYIYMSDWVDGWVGLGKGRIFRLSDPNHVDSEIVRNVSELLQSDWNQRSEADLIGDLEHADQRVRLEAQWELALRGNVEVFATALKSESMSSIARLHCVWALDQIARANSLLKEKVLTAIRTQLQHTDEVVQAASAKVLGEFRDQDSLPRIRQMILEGSSRQRYFATLAAGDLKDLQSFGSVVSMLAENANRDPAIRHAGVSYLEKMGRVEEIGKLKSHPSVAVRRAAVVALRRLKNPRVSAFLDDKDPLVLSEAVRAIHDVPIPISMPDLAEVLENETSDKVVIRRALNANFRIGSSEAATRVAKYAARGTAPADMRIEALSMLLDWARPDPRDRVLNDYRPLESRDRKVAPEALLGQIDSLMITDSTVREKMIDVASKLGIKKIAPEVKKRVEDTALTADQRSNALIALARLAPSVAVKAAQKLVTNAPAEVQAASLKVLSKNAPKVALPQIIQATESENVSIRQLAWDLLAKTDDQKALDRIKEGLQEYLAGDLHTSEHLNVVEAAQVSLPDAKQKIDAHLERESEQDPLAKWMPSLSGGDADQGAKLFFGDTKLSCVRCHKVDRAGGEVGPNLTTIGKQKDRRYLLEAICLPNATIAKGFETTVIVDDEGKVHTGIVKLETDDVIEILKADGSQFRIEQDAIEAIRKGNSSMPDDLTKHMTARGLRDLVAYLASLQVDPRAASDTE